LLNTGVDVKKYFIEKSAMEFEHSPCIMTTQQPIQQPIQQTVQQPVQNTDPNWIYPPPKFDPLVAAILDLFLCGVGPILLGQVTKGAIIFIAFHIAIIISYVACYVVIGVVGVILCFVYKIFTVMDTINLGNRLKAGVPIMQGECSNSIALFSIKYFLTSTPVFNNADPQTAPQEWQQKVGSAKV